MSLGVDLTVLMAAMPCKGANVNVCVAEGCYDEDCVKPVPLARRLQAVTAERDRLKAQVERVEAALLASDDGSEYEHETDCNGDANCPACWVLTIRNAIRGFDPDRDLECHCEDCEDDRRFDGMEARDRARREDV